MTEDDCGQTQDFMADATLLHPGENLSGACLWLDIHGAPCGEIIECATSSKLKTWGKHCLDRHTLPGVDRNDGRNGASGEMETKHFVSTAHCNWFGCHRSAFTTVAALEKHIIAHLGFDKWTCRRCSKTLARYSRSLVERHMKTCKPKKDNESVIEAAPKKRPSKKRRTA